MFPFRIRLRGGCGGGERIIDDGFAVHRDSVLPRFFLPRLLQGVQRLLHSAEAFSIPGRLLPETGQPAGASSMSGAGSSFFLPMRIAFSASSSAFISRAALAKACSLGDGSFFSD